MTVSFNLRKLIHRKSPEYLAQAAFGNTVAGGFLTADDLGVMPEHDHMYFVNSVNGVFRYSADEDSWLQLPNSGIAGTFVAGACGKFRALSCPGGVQTLTASGVGTTTTIQTNLSLVRSIKGHRIRIVDGAGVGYDGLVLSNTMGANSIITLASAAPAATGVTTKFQIFGGSLWFFCPGAGTVGFRVYDCITNAWNLRTVTGLPTTWGTDGNLVSTGSAQSNAGAGFATGTASAGAAAALTDAAKNWPVNGWTNAQVRIVSGTGKGQIRAIASNTATILTLASAWTVVPDATSVYVIEGNDDYLYLMGNNAVALYRYSIVGDAWSTLAPAAARAGAPGTGATASFADNVPAWAEAQAITYGVHHAQGLICQNGRYIYCLRGGNTATLDVYDIAANTWISALTYGSQSESFTTGSSAADGNGMIFIQKDATGRMFRFDIAQNRMDPLFLNPSVQSTAVVGTKVALQTFTEGVAKGIWVYALLNTRSEFTRFFAV